MYRRHCAVSQESSSGHRIASHIKTYVALILTRAMYMKAARPVLWRIFLWSYGHRAFAAGHAFETPTTHMFVLVPGARMVLQGHLHPV